MATRTLATKRERVIATLLLLTLAAPCSAQLGVISVVYANPNYKVRLRSEVLPATAKSALDPRQALDEKARAMAPLGQG